VHERASKEWAAREAHAHTRRLHAVRRAYRAGAQCCHPSARSHSPEASTVARRESKAPSRPPFPLALYTQLVPVCLHSINLLLSLAVGAVAVISAAFVVFGLIDAFVPNSFFLPCLDRRRGHAQRGAADLHAGQLPVEGQVPEPQRALPLKAAVPAHAQRMSSLLAADKAHQRWLVARARRLDGGGGGYTTAAAAATTTTSRSCPTKNLRNPSQKMRRIPSRSSPKPEPRPLDIRAAKWPVIFSASVCFVVSVVFRL
jgi:hypothetical protein